MVKPPLKPHLPYPILLSTRRCRRFLSFSPKPNFQNQGFPNLVQAVCEILSNPRIPWRGSSELKSLTPKLKPFHVARIIETHSNTDCVLQFFYWVSKCHFYKHDMCCYMSMLNRLVKDQNFAPADHVRILMIKASRDEGEIRRVVDFLNEIGSKGLSYSLYTFNSLLIQLGKVNMVVAAPSGDLSALVTTARVRCPVLSTLCDMRIDSQVEKSMPADKTLRIMLSSGVM